ncbi:hypothetical protein BDZ91DRAFT_204524 [Kalaharituber pfeilii]|nr:hypothetical protein BDZ91DRAFT_204524 [Kalaharituber pfeilii]
MYRLLGPSRAQFCNSLPFTIRYMVLQQALGTILQYAFHVVPQCNNPTRTPRPRPSSSGPILATNILLASTRTRAADSDTLAIRRTPSSTPIYICAGPFVTNVPVATGPDQWPLARTTQWNAGS